MGARLFGSLAAVMAVYFLLPVRWEEGIPTCRGCSSTWLSSGPSSACSCR